MLNNKFMSGMNIGSGRFCYLSFILELLLFSDKVLLELGLINLVFYYK